MNIVETDICIVGSGMGGGTLALRLAEAGLRPLLIEAGNDVPNPSAANLEHSGRPFGLDQSRAIELGGSTNLWHGVVSPLDRRDFAGNDDYSGWPVDYDTMVPYWSAALRFLGFQNPDLAYFSQLDPGLKKLAKDIEYDETQVGPKLFRVMGQPRRLKVDLLRAAAAGTLKLMQDATALECVADAAGTRVKHMIVGQNGERFIVKAERFVICAGALATPRLLLNSLTFGDGGLGNATRNVGKFLMDHPMGFLGKIKFKRPRRASLFSDLRGPDGNRFRIGLVPSKLDGTLNSNLYLRPAIPGATPEVENAILVSLIAVRKARELSARHVWNLVTNPKVLYRIIANRYVLPIRYRAADLFFVTEQTPTTTSQVVLHSERVDNYGYPEAKINWKVSEKDLHDVGNFIDKLVSAGLKSDQYSWDEVPSLDRWRTSFTSAAHHLGTARSAADAQNGVVDGDLKIHGVENVWICDGSVFPTGGNANPSLTICALAHRLSEHLLKNKKISMITVAVTGSNGFIGSNFVNAAKGRFNVKLIGRNIAYPDLPNAKASLDDEDRLTEVLSGCDAIVHCAHTGTDESENVLWATNLIRAAKRAGVKRMVAFGSFATYDNQGNVITQTTPKIAAKIPYVVEKIRLEKTLDALLKTEYPTLQLSFLQPTIVIGKGGSWDRFARRLQRTERIYLPNKGSAVCNLVSVEKVVDAVCRCLEAAPDFYHQGSMRKLLIAADAPTTWARWLVQDYGIPASKIEACNDNSWAESAKRNMILSLRYSLLGSVLTYLKQLRKRANKSSHSSGSSLAQIDVASEKHEAFFPEGLDRLTLSCRAVVKGDRLP